MGVSKRPFKVTGKTSYHYKLEGRRLSLSTANYSEACELLKAVKKAYMNKRLAWITGECDMTLGQFQKEYEPWAEDTQPTKTFKANRLALRKVIDIEGGSQRLDRLTLKAMDELKRKNRKLKPSSINNYIRHSKAVMNKAVEWGYLRANPFRGAKLLQQTKRVAFIEPKQISDFIKSVEDVGLRRFIVASLATGRRRSELFNLRWEDILWDKKKYFIAKEKRHLCKTYPMSASFLAVLKSMRKGKGRIFNRFGHVDTYTHEVKEALKNGGFGNLCLHDLRHSFSVAMIESGGGMKALQKLLGHSEFRTTSDIYADVTDDTLADAVNLVKLGPMDLFSTKKK
ncbi:MAG: site-specific integrase [Pseudodesulfovibrio sp.]|nr:site-specific integrase [Pseudodesulfovibrio sp.]